MAKLCPLLFSVQDGIEECRYERCGWWNRQQSQCAIVCLSTLRVLSDDVLNLRQVIEKKEK